jgi:hypothetical protein
VLTVQLRLVIKHVFTCTTKLNVILLPVYCDHTVTVTIPYVSVEMPLYRTL